MATMVNNLVIQVIELFKQSVLYFMYCEALNMQAEY